MEYAVLMRKIVYTTKKILAAGSLISGLAVWGFTGKFNYGVYAAASVPLAYYLTKIAIEIKEDQIDRKVSKETRRRYMND